MRVIKLCFAVIFGLALIILALANREIVTLKVLPNELAGLFAWSGSIDLPLFLVILLGVLIGLLIGFFWEYFREHKHRSALRSTNKEVRGLKREVSKLKEKTGDGKDEILALLDEKP